MAHPIIHVELSTHDRQETSDFYSKLFGWQTQDFPEMEYTTFLTDEGGVGGGFNPVQDTFPAGTVVIYIETDDINAKLDEVKAHGGHIVVPPMPIPGVGHIAHFTDPTGNRIGLLQPSVEVP